MSCKVNNKDFKRRGIPVIRIIPGEHGHRATYISLSVPLDGCEINLCDCFSVFWLRSNADKFMLPSSQSRWKCVCMKHTFLLTCENI